LVQGCWGCGDGVVTVAAATAEACQAYCNSMPGTVCCDWADGTSPFCFANTDPACKVPTSNGPGMDCTVTGWSCAAGMPNIWASNCD
jgi:hypothetical protein